MGCDGGTIPRRDELVRVKKKPEQKDKEAELAFRWKHCAIRQLPLQSPVVACGLGRLYSKESVIEGLLDRTMLPDTAKHIKSVKDVKDLNLTDNPAYEGPKAEKGDCYVDGGRSPYICPVIGLEMNGKYKFCFLWSCGCVMSERSLREVKTKVCHKCQQPFDETDIVIMNAEGEDLEQMEQRSAMRKLQRKAQKKRVHNVEKTEGEGSVEAGEGKSKKKIKKEESEGPTKSSQKNSAEDPAYKKSKDSYSVAKDPRATEVFKSLFTSHKSASEQTRAHWVTYNPFYN
ncbi:replication termination factor 2 [Neodiprion virginianus]|uniref:replication termination factor 2 n=1 Tax=Neodiprion fabricii TaxID=2872261 RepID=UPI001ED96E9C|nr:replication termination factor 2 [Neodiprion fabricii]XP_046628968.1 replication termination factor 2 [Neodiprion virginianus]